MDSEVAETPQADSTGPASPNISRPQSEMPYVSTNPTTVTPESIAISPTNPPEIRAPKFTTHSVTGATILEDKLDELVLL